MRLVRGSECCYVGGADIGRNDMFGRLCAAVTARERFRMLENPSIAHCLPIASEF